MLTKMMRQWLPALAVLISPILALATEPVEITFNPFQEAAPAVQKAPPVEAPAAAPAETSAPAAVAKPMETAAPADGVARVGNCGPGACGHAGCSPAGCRNGACSTSGAFPGFQCGSCYGRGCVGCNGHGVVGGCRPGCQAHSGGPCNCGAVAAMMNNPYLCRPSYTLGDLHGDIHSWKCKARHSLFGDSCDGCSNSWLANEWEMYKCRSRYRSAILGGHLRGKLNYFIPSGGDGSGIPLAGTYARVYATEPQYHDPRDSQVFASPHTGVPTVIPVAPNVRHQYNYSWGIPSSRITPLYNVRNPSQK